MAFVVVKKGAWGQSPPMPAHQCRVNSSGSLVLQAEALARAGIDGEAVVLADAGSLRIAIRSPRADDAADERVAVRLNKNKATGKPSSLRCVSVTAALRALSVEPKEVGGKYALVSKEDLRIVQLMLKPGVRKPGAKRPAASGPAVAAAAHAAPVIDEDDGLSCEHVDDDADDVDGETAATSASTAPPIKRPAKPRFASDD